MISPRRMPPKMIMRASILSAIVTIPDEAILVENTVPFAVIDASVSEFR